MHSRGEEGHYSPGDILVERYRLEAVVGEGGMGIVWAATQLATGRRVALKTLRRNSDDDVARILQEGRILARLRHRNLTQVLDLFEVPETRAVVLVMELLQGESLATHLKENGPLTLAATLEILGAVSAGLKAAHRANVVHRDLKPENIFLSRDDDGTVVVKLLDFGLARSVLDADGVRITSTGAVLGTPTYMAPEQVYGEKEISFAVDVWALGAIFFECVTGRVLFAAQNAGQAFKKISVEPLPSFDDVGLPAELVTVLRRMLSRPVDDRPTDDEVLEVFQKCASRIAASGASEPIVVPPRRPQSTWPSSRIPWWVVLGTMAVGATVLIWSRLDTEPRSDTQPRVADGASHVASEQSSGHDASPQAEIPEPGPTVHPNGPTEVAEPRVSPRRRAPTQPSPARNPLDTRW